MEPSPARSCGLGLVFAKPETGWRAAYHPVLRRRDGDPVRADAARCHMVMGPGKAITECRVPLAPAGPGGTLTCDCRSRVRSRAFHRIPLASGANTGSTGRRNGLVNRSQSLTPAFQ